MAHWGIAHSHVNQLDNSAAHKRGSTVSVRHRVQHAFHVALFVAAFVFVVAMVCGVLA
jgi:hypothetical protein